MDTIKELSRRCMDNSEPDVNSLAYLGFVYACDAEIVVEDSGDVIYLHGQWISEVPDEILFEATRESIYDIYNKLNHSSSENFEALIDERERIQSNKLDDEYARDRYAAQYDEILKLLEEAGAEFDGEDEYDDYDDEDYDGDDFDAEEEE